RWHRPAPAAAVARRLRRSHRRPRGRRVPDGPPGRPRRGHLLRAVDRREPRRRAGNRPPARPRTPGGHHPGRQRPEVPHRPALLLTGPAAVHLSLPSAHTGGMPVRLHHIVVDTHDLPGLARFWTQALGWKILSERDREIVIGPEQS